MRWTGAQDAFLDRPDVTLVGLTGETAVLVATLGQYALTQRSFYEWSGRVDSLRLEVPPGSGLRTAARSGGRGRAPG